MKTLRTLLMVSAAAAFGLHNSKASAQISATNEQLAAEAEAPPAAEPAPTAEPVAEPEAEAAPATDEEEMAPQGMGDAQANNTIYLELLGPGLLYSVNYERRISDFNLRVGVGGAAWGGSGYVAIPVGFNYMGIGSDKHHLELGATANIFYVTDVGGAVMFSPIAGYRLQPKGGGFNLRAGLSPIIAAVGEGVDLGGFLPWPYVSFGASF